MKTCQWTYDGDEYSVWETECGEAFMFSDAGPAENGVKFCCYCGKSVIPVIPAGESNG